MEGKSTGSTFPSGNRCSKCFNGDTPQVIEYDNVLYYSDHDECQSISVQGTTGTLVHELLNRRGSVDTGDISTGMGTSLSVVQMQLGKLMKRTNGFGGIVEVTDTVPKQYVINDFSERKTRPICQVPEELRKKEWLIKYAERFETVDILTVNNILNFIFDELEAQKAKGHEIFIPDNQVLRVRYEELAEAGMVPLGSSILEIEAIIRNITYGFIHDTKAKTTNCPKGFRFHPKEEKNNKKKHSGRHKSGDGLRYELSEPTSDANTIHGYDERDWDDNEPF